MQNAGEGIVMQASSPCHCCCPLVSSPSSVPLASPSLVLHCCHCHSPSPSHCWCHPCLCACCLVLPIPSPWLSHSCSPSLSFLIGPWWWWQFLVIASVTAAPHCHLWCGGSSCCCGRGPHHGHGPCCPCHGHIVLLPFFVSPHCCPLPHHLLYVHSTRSCLWRWFRVLQWWLGSPQLVGGGADALGLSCCCETKPVDNENRS